jgi:hypothetical protein
MYAKYGCIQVSSIIMASSGSDVLPLPGLPAPSLLFDAGLVLL